MTNLLPPKLNEKQYKVIDLYASGRSMDEICREVDVKKDTISRWMATNASFRSLTNQYLGAFLTMSNTRAGALYEKAMKRLEDIIDDPDTSYGVLIKAINATMDLVDRVKKSNDLSGMETTEEITQTMEIGPDNKVISVTEQKNLIRRMRGEPYGEDIRLPSILETESTEGGSNSSTTSEILSGIPTHLGRDT
jgi:predicted DNA-binding protein YlxM (UPF0122 family)